LFVGYCLHIAWVVIHKSRRLFDIGGYHSGCDQLERVSGTVLSRVLDDPAVASVAKKEHEILNLCVRNDLANMCKDLRGGELT
jgi:hypothetical protein